MVTICFAVLSLFALCLIIMLYQASKSLPGYEDDEGFVAISRMMGGKDDD